MSLCGMKQIDERHVANCVDAMVWCSKLDLLVLSTNKGEVQVHRLNWQKVWSLPPPKENSAVAGIAWRPDGKVLAIGYDTGQVLLVDVEDKEILHNFTLRDSNEAPTAVTCMSWCQKSGIISNEGYNNEDADTFLPNPPPLNTGFINKKNEESSTSNFKQIKEQNHLNILIVGFGNGMLHLSVFGQFPCGVVNIKDFLDDKSSIIKVTDIQMSYNFSIMEVFLFNVDISQSSLILLDTDILSAFSEELFALASKHCHILNLVTYVDQTMTSIIEAKEQIILEMETKLEKYAANVPDGSVSADLLDLLMFGTPTDELELFLLQDLTSKGLKKLGGSIELSYSTIQKLVVKQLNTVGQNLTFYLAELRGLARIICRYKVLGLDEGLVTSAILASSAFLNKCLELQQVIDTSMKNYKAFFRWLYVVIVRLMDEHVPSEMVNVTQQDLTYIANFLQNFGKAKSGELDSKRGKFNLERLGQYLLDSELSILPDDDENPWLKFLNENQCVANSKCIISTQKFKKYSLVKQQHHLKGAIGEVFRNSEQTICKHFARHFFFNCLESCKSINDEEMKVTQIFRSEHVISIAMTHLNSEESGFYYLELNMALENVEIKGCFFYFYPSNNFNDSKLDLLSNVKLNVVDIQFYSNEILSVLLQDPKDEEISVFVQFPLKLAVEYIIPIKHLNDVPKVEATKLLDQGLLKVMDKMAGHKLAVSGGRRVAVVLSKSLRKVRLFEMEVDGDEDEDETLDQTPQSISTMHLSHTSMHNSDLEPNGDFSRED